MYTYPVTLKTLGNGDVMVTFPDVPEAVTYGDTPALALEWAQDALHVALAGYMDEHRDIPTPSAPKPGQPTVGPAPLAQIKLAIYQALRDQGVSRLHFARLLHCDARQVRRILDLDHQSTMGQLMDAAAVLGFRLDVALCRADADDIFPAVPAQNMGTMPPVQPC